jgi:hypothetical protein
MKRDSNIRALLYKNPFSLEKECRIVERTTFSKIINNTGLDIYPENYIVAFDGTTKVTNFNTIPESNEVIIRVFPFGDGGSSGGGTPEEQLEKMVQDAPLVALIGFMIGGVIGIVPGILMGIGAQLGLDTLDSYEKELKDALKGRATPERLPSIRGSKNKSGAGKAVPILLGEHLIYPYFGAPPYTEVVDGDLYLHQLFILGYNNLTIDESTIKIGENSYTNYLDGNYELIQDGTLPTLYPERVVESRVGVPVTHTDGPIIRTTSTSTNKISVTVVFSAGLLRYNDDGKKRSASISYKFEYRAADSSDAWSTLASASFSEKTNSSFIKEYSLTLDNATSSDPDYNAGRQYEVRLTRNTSDDRERTTDKFSWGVLRSHTATFDEVGGVDTSPIDATTRTDLTIMTLNVKATDQFNGVIDELNVVGQAKIRDYNGSTWVSDTYTSNPAAVFLHVLTDANANKEPVVDSSIDFDTLEAWYTYCETNNLSFNAYINKDVSLLDLLNDISAAGNAKWFFVDNKYKIAIDDEISTITQYFTPRNSWDFTGSKKFGELTTGYKAKFVNASTGYTEEVRNVYYNNVVDDSFLDDIGYYGVTNQEQIHFLSQRNLRKTRYRTEVFSFKADVEALVCTIGDRIKLLHDVPLFGLSSGRIIAVLDTGTEDYAIISDEDILYEVGKSYQVRVRLSDGSSVLKDVDNPATVTDVISNEIQFTTYSPLGTFGIQNLFMFGESGLESVDLIVQRVNAYDDFTVELQCVEYSPEIFATSTPDAYDPKISKPGNGGGDFAITNFYESDVLDAIELTKNLFISNQSIEVQRPASYDITIAKGIYHRFSEEGNSYFISTDFGYKVYKKDTFDRLSDGVEFYNKPTTDLVVLSEDEIIITSIEDGNNLYRYDGTTETQLTSVTSNRPVILSDTELLYVNYDDNITLYKKSIDTLDNGTKVLDLPVESYCVISDHEIVYSSPVNSSKLYYKDLDVVGNGSAITTSGGVDPVYDTVSGDIYYVNIDTYIIYKTSITDTDDGALVFPFAFALTIDVDGNLGYTDIVNGRLKIALAEGKKTKLDMVIPAPPADISFTADLSIGSVNLQNVDDELIGIASVGDAVASEYLPLGTTITYIGVNYLEVSNAATNTSSSQLCFLNASADYIGESSLLPGAITETKISDDAISTPKLQANCVSADKLEANILNALIAQINERLTVGATGFTGYNISGEELAINDTRVFVDRNEVSVERCIALGDPNTPDNATWESLLLFTVGDNNVPKITFRDYKKLERASENSTTQDLGFPQFSDVDVLTQEFFAFDDKLRVTELEVVEDAFGIYDDSYRNRLELDTSSGTAITSVSSVYPTYIGNGEIVYRNGSDGFLYKKSVNDTSSGTAITSVNSSYSTYIGNGEIVYTNGSDSGKLYKKSVNDTSSGTAITSVNSAYPTYIGNGEIVYRNGSDSNKLYKKSVNDTLNGMAITSVNSFYSLTLEMEKSFIEMLATQANFIKKV